MCTHSICAYTQLATVTAVSGQQRVRNPSSCRSKLLRKSFVRGAALRQHAANGTKCTAFFKLGGQTSSGGGVYGAQKRADYTSDDVEQYFNYMGMLAEQGSYDALEQVLASDIHPADLLLQWASSEGDTPKAAELLRAGADPNAKNLEGKTPAELTKSDEIRMLLEDPEKAKTFEQD